MAYLSLFFAAIIAATIFPFSSEALLAALVYQEKSLLLLWLVATTGNSLGSCINWYLGGKCLQWQEKHWFPVKQIQLVRAQQLFQRYGVFSLLFAWVPVIGDPLTFVAGIMRVSFRLFVALVVLGKAVRYAVVIWLTQVALA
ncbi:DedA family protein [Cellvibrio sp. KY-GH-1]|uniref:YqaA family protein n=1 Tax=Cellvibrio sp. KY-GH-1 TaxID=2303332 RepID=UPI00124529AF|nr:YqaA family protein [Cellvibrio sp. KY-GH-1]QEY17743.1 DedA family protein [Cellvibrio sp. KY-GH-1]